MVTFSSTLLSFLQARNSDWCYRPFFAKFDPEATWLGDLKPAFGKEKFFYESQLEELLTEKILNDQNHDRQVILSK